MFKAVEENEQIYKKAMLQIQNLIMNNELKVGEKLPPERQLAEMLNVSRPALKQAISALSAIGLIHSRQGDGNYVVSNTGEIFNPLALNFYLNKGEENNILEFRYILEVNLVGLAALKATEEQIEELYNIVEKMNNTLTSEERLSLNNDFHRQIISLSGNSLILTIYDSISNIINHQLRSTDGVNFYKSHYKIYKAIKDRDPQKAHYYMANHFIEKFPNYDYYGMMSSNFKK